MDLSQISFMFNRALNFTFSKKKFLIVFATLALSGLLVVFFRGLAWNANDWVQLSLTFLPIFLCGGILLSLGIFLIRIYHNEVKGKHLSYNDILAKSWDLIIGSSYFAVPVVLIYLLLWMLLGIFVLLKEIPSVGEFFSAVLSFAPFLINFMALLLCVFCLLVLFFVAPVIALKGLDKTMVVKTVMKRIKRDPFSNILSGIIALIPLLFILSLLILSATLTETICLDCNTLTHTVLKWFFIMLPFTALLAPAIIFFFNFAAEAHVLMQKNQANK